MLCKLCGSDGDFDVPGVALQGVDAWIVAARGIGIERHDVAGHGEVFGDHAADAVAAAGDDEGPFGGHASITVVF